MSFDYRDAGADTIKMQEYNGCPAGAVSLKWLGYRLGPPHARGGPIEDRLEDYFVKE